MIMEEEGWSSLSKGEICVGNTYFEYKSLHKYRRMARGQDGLEVKSMVDLLLVKKNMLDYVQVVSAVRGIRQGTV